MAELLFYTVDDEEPDCNNCEHCCDDFFCSKRCGPKYGWAGYQRVKLVNEAEFKERRGRSERYPSNRIMKNNTKPAGLAISIQKAMNARNCSKKGELSHGLLSATEKSHFQTELGKIQGEYFGKKESIQKVEDFIRAQFKREWFQMDAQYDILIQKEIDYQEALASFFIGKKAIANNIIWSLPISFSVGDKKVSEIYGHVNAIYKEEKEESLTAVIISDGKASYSRYARSLYRKPEYAPELLGAYLDLSKTFGKDLKIQLAYTRPKKDSDNPIFNEEEQLVTADFSNLSEDMLKERLLMVLKTGEESPDCSTCPYEALCTGMNIPRASMPDETREIKGKREPKFTKSQEQVVNFKEGSCAVYAVPGAGKTTTLVYRLIRLLNEGINPKSILFVTFTNKAAEEIRSRVKSLLHTEFEEELPDIYTYNGLGWQILRDHRDIVGNLKLLTSLDEKRLLMECIDSFSEPLINFSYRYIEGKYGLLSHLLRIFNALDEEPDSQKQLLTEKGYSLEQILKLKSLYEEHLADEHYINFDQQVSLAKEILCSHPEICKEYGERWTYIMADEYQDSSQDNVDLLYAISDAGKRNLVVVGDADQSIYEWRNGSPKHLLDFQVNYPEAKRIFMTDNFRSVRQILDASNELISKNLNRIDMSMVAHKESKALPYRIKNCSIPYITYILELLRKNNYEYGDIAVLSRNNSALIKVKAILDKQGIFSVSPSDYLIKDTIFILVKDILDLYFLGFLDTKDIAFCRYMTACGCKLPMKQDLRKTTYQNLILYHDMTPIRANDMDTMMAYDIEDEDRINDQLFIAYQQLYRLFISFTDSNEPLAALNAILNAFNADMDAPAVLELKRLIEQQNFTCLLEFWKYLTYMVELKDERMVEHHPTPDKVNLMTTHGSKGKEFLAVIILQSEDFKDTEEERRLLYVGMTRAKKCLFMLESPNQECEILNDISEYMQTSTFQ